MTIRMHRLTLEARRELVARQAGLSALEVDLLSGAGLDAARADKMIENCVGVFSLPLGVGTDVVVNGREHLVPMVVEEASVVAAMSRTSKLVKDAGGFAAEADPARMIGQVQLLDVPDLPAGKARILAARSRILAEANRHQPGLVRRGGGAIDLDVRIFHEPIPMLIAHVVIDCLDAMGANAVNTTVESLAPTFAELSRGRPLLRILSNLADQRLVRARCRIPAHLLARPGFSGIDVVDGVVAAWAMAEADPYRAATHNKGVMNGIDAVAIATGNDFRGVEAGAHAFAARDGRYRPITRWSREGDTLVGAIELPLAVGTVGGSTEAHPVARVARTILGVTHAGELGCVMAAVGLAQNLGALRALVTDGIQHGHMRLHARSVALAAGAAEGDVDRIARAMVHAGSIRLDAARAMLEGERA